MSKSRPTNLITAKMVAAADAEGIEIFTFTENQPYVVPKDNYVAFDMSVTEKAVSFWNTNFPVKLKVGSWCKFVGTGVANFHSVSRYLEDQSSPPSLRIVFDNNVEDDIETFNMMMILEQHVNALVEKTRPFSGKLAKYAKDKTASPIVENADKIDHDFGDKLYELVDDEHGEKVFINPASVRCDFFKLISTKNATPERPAGTLKTVTQYSRIIERKDKDPLIISDKDVLGLAPGKLPDKFLSMPNYARTIFTFFMPSYTVNNLAIKIPVKVSELYVNLLTETEHHRPMVRSEEDESSIRQIDFSSLGLSLGSSIPGGSEGEDDSHHSD